MLQVQARLSNLTRLFPQSRQSPFSCTQIRQPFSQLVQTVPSRNCPAGHTQFPVGSCSNPIAQDRQLLLLPTQELQKLAQGMQLVPVVLNELASAQRHCAPLSARPVAQPVHTLKAVQAVQPTMQAWQDSPSELKNMGAQALQVPPT